MKVAWVNPDKPNKGDGYWAVPCAVCGMELLPFNHYCVYELPVGWMLGAYEELYYVCSEKCNEEALAGKKDERWWQLTKDFADIHTDGKIPSWIKKIFQEPKNKSHGKKQKSCSKKSSKKKQGNCSI